MRLGQEHLKALLRPLVRLFVRHAASIHDFVSAGKALFVEMAVEELNRQGKQPTVSSISAMTGLYRKEVAHIYRGGGEPLYQGASIIARVLAKWERDRRYSTNRGGARPLTWGNAKSEFGALVHSVSSDTHEGAILGEMRRAELVAVEGDRVVLKKREAYVPGDVDRAIRIIEGTLESGLRSGEENALRSPEPRNLHLRTAYDNIYRDKLVEIRAWVLEQGRDFHRRLREYIAPFDADEGVDQEPGRPAGGRIVISSCSYGASADEE